jgi:hypothetical protein
MEHMEGICYQKDDEGVNPSEKLIKDRFKEDLGREMNFEEKKAMRKVLVKREREQSFLFFFLWKISYFFGKELQLKERRNKSTLRKGKGAIVK